MTISLASLRVEAAFDASAYTRGAQQKTDADTKMVATGNQLTATLDQTERKLSTSGTAFDRFQRSIDPAFASQQKFEQGARNVQKALEAGAISTERAAQLLTLLEQKYKSGATAANENAKALAGLSAVANSYAESVSGIVTIQNRLATSLAGTSDAVKRAYSSSVQPIDTTTAAVARNYQASVTATKGMQDELSSRLAVRAAYEASINPVTHLTAATQQATAAHNASAVATQAVGTAARFTYTEMSILRSGAINTFQSLAAGEGVARTLTTQLTQTAPAFGALGRAMGGLGTIAAVAGLAAVAGGIVYLTSRAIDSQDRVRSYGAMLKGMGADAITTATNLEAVTRRLRDAGLSTADAQANIAAVTRSGLNPAAAGQIIQTGRDLGPALGSNSIEQLRSALAGGIEDTIKLGLQIHALSAAEVDNYREMARHGQAAAALDRAFAKITGSVKGLEEQALSPASKAMRELRAAYSDLADKLSDSAFITTIAKGMTELVKATKDLADLKPPAWLSSLMGASVPGVGALGGYLAGSAMSGAAASGGVMATAAVPPATNGVGTQPAASAVDAMLQFSGMSGGNSAVKQFLATNGVDLDPASAAWCAAFVNAALNYAGISHPGTNNTAASFKNFGTAVADPSQVLPNDVLYTPAEGYTGHVGLATGRTRQAASGLQIEMMSSHQVGPLSNPAGTDWRSAANLTIRRATDAQSSAAGDASLTRPDDVTRQTAAIDDLNKARQREIDVAQKVGEAADILRVKQEAETYNAEHQITGLEAQRNVLGAVAAAKAKVAAESDKALASGELEISNTRKIASAYLESSKAGLEAEATAKATTEAYERYGPAADKLVAISVRRSQLLGQETAAEEKRNAQDIIGQRDTQAGLQLEISLIGQSSDVITQQLTLLRAKQQIDEQFPLLSQKEKDARLATVSATADLTRQLSQTQREQQRLEDGIRSIADTIDSSLTTAIQNAFDPTKVTDWGATIRNTLASITSSLFNSLLIKPAIGSALGAFGFGNLAQQYGSFGSLFGGSSASTAGGVTLTPNGSGGFSLSTAAQGAGLLKDGYGLFGGGNSGGGFLSNIFGSGSLFGSQGALFGSAADLSIAGGGPPLALGAGGEGLFSALGGSSGLGLSGGLLSSIGSFLPYVGLAAGAGFLLSNLFGNKTPPGQATGGAINLSTGGIAGTYLGGSQLDQPTQQAVQSLSQFTQSLLKMTGGSLAGTVGISQDLNTGLTLNGNLGAYNGSYRLGKNADLSTILPQLELYIAQQLTGVSDTVKQIISTITDPSQIQSALQFATVYDNLETAADSAFQSLAGDTKQIGPFEQAMDGVKQTFAALTTQAQQYGLSLDPITAAQDKAMERLRTDFSNNIADLMLAITDPVKLAIQQEQQAGKLRVADAQAIGADIVQVNRLNAAELDGIWKAQTQSLKQLSDSLKTGSLSGLTITGQLGAANDNFQNELRLVRGGNLNEISNLASAGQNALQLSQTAYGNAPQTAALRNTIVTAVDDVLAHRSFASGTNYTPPGWIRVGENGPETIFQPGGLGVLPNGGMPAGGGAGDLVGLLRKVVAHLEGGNRINQAVGVEQINQLKGLRNDTNRQPAQLPQRRKVS